MLHFIADALRCASWLLIGIALFTTIINRFAVKGTRRRYVSKTVLLATLVVLWLMGVASFLIQMYIDSQNPLARPAYTISAAVLTVIYTRLIYMIFNEDDDDWFNDQRKKLKRWIKKLCSAPRRKLASMPTH